MVFFDFDGFMDVPGPADEPSRYIVRCYGQSTQESLARESLGGQQVDAPPCLRRPSAEGRVCAHAPAPDVWDGIDQIVFICGVARSGTTLMADMLGLHSKLSPLYETYFVTHLACLVFRQHLELAELHSAVMGFMERWTEPLPLRNIPGFKGEHERFHHGPNYLLFSRELAMQRTRTFLMEISAGRPRMPAFARFVSALFIEHARQDGGKRIVVNKTPSYTDILPLLAKMCPRLKVVHCVRDGRDVACSVLARPWGPSTVSEASSWWARKAGLAVEWGKANPHRYLEVRYEDLLKQSRKALSRLWDFIGVGDETDAILSFYRGSVPLDKGRVGAWQRLSEEDTARFLQGQAGMLLRHFGYVGEQGIQTMSKQEVKLLCTPEPPEVDQEWLLEQLAQITAHELEGDRLWEKACIHGHEDEGQPSVTDELERSGVMAMQIRGATRSGMPGHQLTRQAQEGVSRAGVAWDENGMVVSCRRTLGGQKLAQ
mmetsp:Transcript_79473/g.219851  ORF Transcript_79473/g.219851 Transcript_79473/m.219851 type:complete len:486 (-) Transcript_79473:114-1571(-)